MKVKTKVYGELEINPVDIITFEKGLIGFEDKKKFVLLGDPEIVESLVLLQCIDDENLAFVVIQPKFFKPDYQPVIKLEEIEELDLQDESRLLLYAIVVIPEDISQMTANLKAPLILNTENNKAKQLVLNDESYAIKELIMAAK